MKDAEKVSPEFELQIGGVSVPVACTYRTIFEYEKSTGKPLASLFTNGLEIVSVAVIVEFLHAAIKHLDKKYSKDWILDNLTPSIIKAFGNEIFPNLIKRSYLGEEEGEEEKNDEVEK